MSRSVPRPVLRYRRAPSDERTVSTLAVFSHFDRDGLVAPHVLRYVRDLAGAVDRLIVVSTADLAGPDRGELAGLGELIVRENIGYDFYSWKVGLDTVGDWTGYDRVLLANDSVVGPLRPMPEILRTGPGSPADFWGMTASHEITPHVQSWFLVFERAALDSPELAGFWREMTPISDRRSVIVRYELGLSRLLLGAGLRPGAFLHPNRTQFVRAMRRFEKVLRSQPERAAWARKISGAHSDAQWREVLARRPPWNPTHVFWDCVLDGGLPFVKLELLRDDPYRLGRQKILSQLERTFPEPFAGVRDYLRRTAPVAAGAAGKPGPSPR
jgi:hypothetical protein